VSGLDALSPEEKDVLAAWNAGEIERAAEELRAAYNHTGGSYDAHKAREWAKAKAAVEKSLARLSRLLGEPK
jgi:hypothetical protein